MEKKEYSKLEPLQRIEEPKPVNIPPKPKTLARDAKNDQIQYNESCYDYVDEMASKYKIDGEVMRRIIKAESGGNPNAKNKNSTASGCSQFIKSTWEGTLRQMGREYISPFDARTNVEAMAFKISRGGIGAWNASKNKWSK
jgi:soluble lytic murein transglycosylase-like protein